MLGGWDKKIPVMLQSTVVDALQGEVREARESISTITLTLTITN
jgi:hypothetical protein